MPNRLLKEGICTSDAINSLPSDSEVLFYRLLVVADDYGRMDGRMQIVKSQCFPLKDSFTTKKIDASLNDLQQAGLITVYIVDDKPFFFINKWDQRQRSKSKYPDPLTADCAQPADDLQKDAETCGLGSGKGMGKGKGKGEDKENNKKKTADSIFKFFDDVSIPIMTDFIAHRKNKKALITETAMNGIKREAEKAGISLETALKECCERGWVGFKAEWHLNASGQQGKKEKFDPVEYVNRGRIRGDDETSHTIIDV